MEISLAVFALLAGMIVGSFLNVVIWRLPRGESVVTPRSRCPGCGQAIVWYDNIPVLSWMLLRGRCRGCSARIGARYPLVEALTGGLFLLAWLVYSTDATTGILVALALAALVAISFIDLDHRIIPDRITKPGMVVMVALAPLSALHDPNWIDGLKPALNAFLHAGAGVAVGAGVVYLIRVLGSWVLKKEAMGLGDVKLLGFIGAVVGPLQVLYALALGCLGGAVIGGVMYAVGKRRPTACQLTVRGKGVEASFDRVRLRGLVMQLPGRPPVEAGTELKLDLVLPAAKVLEDEDAHLDLRARVLAAQDDAPPDAWRMEVLEPGDEDSERLEIFAFSYRYIPFGPFLAIGGALTMLFGAHVHWLLTVGYPNLVRP